MQIDNDFCNGIAESPIYSPDKKTKDLEKKILELEAALAFEKDRADKAESRAIKAEELSIEDDLTKLPNKRFLDKTLNNELSEVARGEHALAVLMIDIDHFKYINDSIGHEGGNEAIKSIGNALKEAIRAGDVLCRYGGDEFVIILKISSNNNEEKNLPDILQRVLTSPNYIEKINQNRESVPHTISMGCAFVPKGTDFSLTDVMVTADKALYDSKRDGRNRYTISNMAYS